MKIKLFICVCIALLFISCTSAPSKPREPKVSNAVKIAVLPFTSTLGEMDKTTEKIYDGFALAELLIHGTSWSADEQNVALCFEAYLEALIERIKYFIPADSVAVKKAIESKTELPCQYYIIGTMTDFDSDYNEEEFNNVTSYQKTVKTTFVCKLIEAKTGKVIVSSTYDFDEESSFESQKLLLPSAENLLEDPICDAIVNFMTLAYKKLGFEN